MPRLEEPDLGPAMDGLQNWADGHNLGVNVREQSRCYLFANRYLYAELPNNTRLLFDGTGWHAAERVKF